MSLSSRFKISEEFIWSFSNLQTYLIYLCTSRSSRSQIFKIGVLKNFAIFTGNNFAIYTIFLHNCNFIKKRLQRRCFPVIIAKFLRTVFFIEYLWWLLLYGSKYSEIRETSLYCTSINSFVNLHRKIQSQTNPIMTEFPALILIQQVLKYFTLQIR